MESAGLSIQISKSRVGGAERSTEDGDGLIRIKANALLIISLGWGVRVEESPG